MIFLFKKKKLVLDLFTSRQAIFDAAKPRMAAQFYPNWWKELKIEMPDSSPTFPMPTMRRCMGLVDHYKHGFILPMWSDFRVELGEIGSPYMSARMSDQTTPIVIHDPKQRGNFAPADKFCHLKFESPWSAKCAESIYFKWEQVTWNSNKLDEYIVLPATVEFKYQPYMQVHVLYIRKEIKQVKSINFGAPMVHITPLTERELELRYHLISAEEHEKFFSLVNRLSFVNAYKTYRRAKDNDEQKCPYA
jgi:hypothetical protein